MEHGGEPAVLPQLLQDEDVSCHWGHPHELRSSAECLQSLVSDSRYKDPGSDLTFVRVLTAWTSICVRHQHAQIKLKMRVFDG